MKAPSFYCENCGRAVNPNLNICPGCGEKFISVRCPSCGFTGNAELFKKNCPGCGYVGDNVIDGFQDSMSHTAKPVNLDIKIGSNSKKHLSLWIYRVLIAALIVVIIYLIRIYFLL